MKHLFSVILPTYNRRRELERCLKSIKRQSFQDFEIIVVDDGSNDNTDEFISKYHPDVRYFYQKNQGVASARNLGMQMAEGQYFAFIDSDDVWYPHRLEVLNEIITQLPPQVVLVFNDMDRIVGGRGDGRSYSNRYFGVKNCHVIRSMDSNINVSFRKGSTKLYYGNAFIGLLKGNIIQPSCAILKKEVFAQTGGFREDFRVANDSEYFLRVSRHYPIGFVDMILTSLEPLRSAISLSLPANSIEKIENTIKVIKGFHHQELGRRIKKQSKKRLSNLQNLLGYEYLSQYRKREAKACYKKAIRLNAWNFRLYLMFCLAMLPEKLLKILAISKRFITRRNQT